MKQLRIGILDLVTQAPTRALYARVMNPNMASIMPQALAVWCEEAGHDVHFICYTGFEDLLEELPEDLDIRIQMKTTNWAFGDILGQPRN